MAAFAGGAPVIAGVGGSLPVAVAMARRAAAAGAHGILALPPYYPGAPDDGLVDYYRAIGQATPLGMLVYGRDWFNPGPELVARLAAAIPTLVAWKDGIGDLRRYQMIKQRVGDRLAWVGGAGDDMVPGYYAMGLRAYTSSIATVAPALSIALDKVAAAGDSAGADPADERVRDPALRPAGPQEGLRGVGHEGGDGRRRAGGRRRPPAAGGRSSPRRPRRSGP